MNANDGYSGGEMEWDFLEGLWQRAPVESTVPVAIRSRVRRQEWRMRIAAAGEWLTAGFFVALVVWRFTVDQSAATALWGFLVLWFTGWLLSVSVSNRRGLWLPAAETARDYLKLARRRIASQYRSLRIAWFAYAAQLGVLVAWESAYRIGLAPPMFADRWLQGLAALALFTAAFAAWTWMRRRRLARETRALDALEQESGSYDSM